MTQSLVVVRPFARHATGETIDDEAEMAAILSSEHASRVVRVTIIVHPTQEG